MRGYFVTLFKQFFRSWSSVFVIAFPLLFLVGLGKLLPAAWIIPAVITVSLTISVMFTFGPNVFELRKTSLIKAMSLTRLTKASIFATNILFTLMIALFSWGATLGFAYIFTEVIDFLAHDFSALDPALSWLAASVNWDGIDWLTMVYTGMLTILLSFALVYMFVAFSKTTQGLYLVSFAYLFALILLGGVIMPSFLVAAADSPVSMFSYFIPHYYVNNMQASAFTTTGMTLGGLTDLITEIEEVINDWFGTVEFEADMEALNAWVAAGSPIDTHWLLGESIDWASVPGYDGYTFQVFEMGVLFEGLGVARELVSTGATYIVPLLNELNPGNADSMLKVLFSWFESTEAWDLTSWKSTLDIFMPWTMIIGSSAVGIINFKWSQR